MLRRDYFLLAMNAGLYKKKAWLLTVMAIVEFPDSPASEMAELEGYPFYDDGVLGFLHEGEFQTIEGYEEGKPMFPKDETFQLKAGELANVNGDIKTTYGNALINTLYLIYPFGNKVPYINRKFGYKEIEKTVDRMARADEITVEELKRFLKSPHFSTGLTQVAVPSATPKTLSTDPAIAKRRAELLKEYAGKLDDPAIVAKVEQELIAMDKEYIKGDESEGFYIKGKMFNIVRKRSHIFHGGEASFKDPGKMTLIPNSLNEGWDVSYLPEMANSLRMGSYARGAETALGGEDFKFFARIFQNSNIAMKDCGSKVYRRKTINKINHRNYVGRYHLVGGKLVKIEDGKTEQLIGKTILLRSPQTCKAPASDFCEICMGENVSMSPNALSMLAANMGSAFLSLFMAAVHGKQLLLQEYDPNLSIT